MMPRVRGAWRKHAVVAASILSLAACAATRTHQSTGERIDDGATKTRVKAALIRDPVTKARDINVDVFRGEVVLSGFVDNGQERREAVQVAHGVDGVKSVRDRLVIKPSGS